MHWYAAPRSALGLLAVVAIGPWLELYNAQHRSRVLMTRALVEQGTFSLDAYRDQLGVDRVEIDGHVYSDKAPGQPVAAVPLYWLADRLEFADSREVRSSTYGERDDYPALYHLGAWWLGFWFAAVPAGVLAATMFLRTRAWYPRRALTASLALTGSTILLTFGSELYSHLLAATLVYLSWQLLEPLDTRAPHPAWAGFLASVAVSTDYATGIVVLVLVTHLVVNRRTKDLFRFCLAAVPVAVLLAWYHQFLFGRPWQLSYGVKDQDHLVFPPRHLVEVLFGSRGFIFTPVVFLALWGIVVLARKGGRHRQEALVAAGIFAGHLLLQSSWVNPWGGEMPGPRYMIPALPFLALPLAAGWHRRLGALACSLGAISMVLPLVTVSLVPSGGALITSHLSNLRDFGMAPTIYETVLGRWIGLATYLIVLSLAAAHAARVFREHQVAVEAAEP